LPSDLPQAKNLDPNSSEVTAALNTYVSFMFHFCSVEYPPSIFFFLFCYGSVLITFADSSRDGQITRRRSRNCTAVCLGEYMGMFGLTAGRKAGQNHRGIIFWQF
jgi:hypothetical protein